MALKVTIDSKAARDHLEMVERELPGATAKTLNNLGFAIQADERDNISKVFPSARPFTTKSVGITKATESNPEVTVFVKDKTARYLEPYESGGMRYLPGKGITWLRPVDIRKDQYGKLPGGAFKRAVGRDDTFFGKVDGISGLWQRMKASASGKGDSVGGIKLLVRFGDTAPVKKHLGFVDHAEALVQAGFSEAFGEALRRMMAKRK